jgi:hypothetical protein
MSPHIVQYIHIRLAGMGTEVGRRGVWSIAGREVGREVEKDGVKNGF